VGIHRAIRYSFRHSMLSGAFLNRGILACTCDRTGSTIPNLGSSTRVADERYVLFRCNPYADTVGMLRPRW